jgi:hypothetical protein
MEWVESTCRTVRCSKRATKVAEVILHKLSPVTAKTAAETVVVAVATVVAEVEMTAAATEVQGANDVTLTMIAEDHDRIVLSAQSVQTDQNVQTVTTKAAEIVAQGDPPVVMMVAADDRVRLADAKLSK